MTVLAKGGADKHEALFQGIGKARYGASTPAKAGTQTFDLSVFKSLTTNSGQTRRTT